MKLLNGSRPTSRKNSRSGEDSIEPGLHVAIALHFLATGESYKTLAFQFQVAANTVCSIVPETCRAIVTVYGDEVVQLPPTPEQWKEVASGFEERWNFPHTLGAVDGKHIRIQNPEKGEGSWESNGSGE
ncbi:uncharacterized protein LOC135217545 [Macrobrachium nipponense]|uniref:uncharacterized protein LOC135217545 n=1 Tax=Macrobrachium nipponense TaxID=159736 RepID=UPI0030C805EC